MCLMGVLYLLTSTTEVTDGGESFYTYHAYEQDVESGMHSVQVISDATLAVAKLAGRKK
jgi:hypothetical protein